MQKEYERIMPDDEHRMRALIEQRAAAVHVGDPDAVVADQHEHHSFPRS